MLRTPNTFVSHLLIAEAYAVGGTQMQDSVVEALFVSAFIEGRDIGNPTILALIAQNAGISWDRATAPSQIEEVRMDEANARNIVLKGVPTFLLNDVLLFSGALPTEVMVEQLYDEADRVYRGARSF